MVAISSRVKTDWASSFGSVPVMRTKTFDIALSDAMTGVNSQATADKAGARMRTALSGTENAMFLGTISPMTT